MVPYGILIYSISSRSLWRMEMRRLQNNKYFFSVEGETEELYFKHLKNLILAEEGRIANPALSVHCVIKKILSECGV